MRILKERTLRLGGGIAGLLAAVCFLIVGALRTHEIQDAEPDEFGIRESGRISEAQLVVDTTFTGVIRSNGMLQSTYSRGEPRGKRACPT